MLIVSQNKVSVLNFNNVNLIGANKDGDIKARLGIDDVITLGTYETEERAKEILSQILELYEKCQLVIDDRNRVASYIQRPKVYKMPKE